MPLDKNESYWLLDEALVAACIAHGREALSTYPAYAELKKQIAAYAGVDPSQVALTPGSDAAIETIAEVFVGTGEAILPVPTFYGYEAIVTRAGSQLIPTYYTECDGLFEFPQGETVALFAKGSAKALFLCQPNNPLGCAISDAAIAAILETAKGSATLLVSDEAYFEFSGRTLLHSLAALPNLILVRTLSKGFALSGARIGYVIAAPAIIAKLEERLLPWPIAQASVFAASALLSRASEVQTRREAVIAAREGFIGALRAVPGITVYPSETNFALIRVANAPAVRDALLAAGIRVALGEPMSRFEAAQALLKGTLRIAIPSPEDQAVFLAAFSDLFTK
jgi:histidinol-phosphate aminotransferase